MMKAVSILGRALAIALSMALSACASGGAIAPAPDLLATQGPAPTAKDSGASIEPGQDIQQGQSIEPGEDVASLPDDAGQAPDPYEKMNRSVFERNQKFNHSVLYPTAKAYHDKVPEGVRDSITNFATNLTEPMTFANDVLQLRGQAAMTTLGRFAFNSTFGLAGVMDVATTRQMPHQSGDFGQTLYVWGMHDSPYLVVPVIGPTNVRDLVGTTVEFVATLPTGGLWPAKIATTANQISIAGSVASPVTKLDEVDQMQALEDSSLDFYTMLRSVSEQKRQAELKEAVEESAWTSDSAGAASASAATAGITVAAAPAIFPKPVSTGGLKEQELTATAFGSDH